MPPKTPAKVPAKTPDPEEEPETPTPPRRNSPRDRRIRHHCPGAKGPVDKNGGNCRWEEKPMAYCATHQSYCSTHWIVYMRSKSCPACDRKKQVDAKRAKEDKDKDDPEDFDEELDPKQARKKNLTRTVESRKKEEREKLERARGRGSRVQRANQRRWRWWLR